MTRSDLNVLCNSTWHRLLNCSRGRTDARESQMSEMHTRNGGRTETVCAAGHRVMRRFPTHSRSKQLRW